jgi:hypothetical protein
LLQPGKRNISMAKLSLKIPGKQQFREQKALAGGGYAGHRLRSCGNPLLA